MKRGVSYRTGLVHLLVALMIIAVSSRVWLTHDRGYYENFLRTSHPSAETGAWVSCNCPICHAEDFLAVEAEYFDYQPVVAILLCEYSVLPVAEANNSVVDNLTLRGPPCLS